MRLLTLVTVATAGLVVAQPGLHQHRRHQGLHEKRVANPTPADSAPATVTIYEFNGQQISVNDVQRGIENGTLVYVENEGLSSAVPNAIHATSAPALIAPASSAPVAKAQSVSSAITNALPSSAPVVKAQAVSSSVSSAAPSVSAPVQNSVHDTTSTSSSTFTSNGVNSDFPDGQIDCSTFPSQYGAVSLEWLGLGGWSGIQSPGSTSGGFGNIMTVVSGQCNGQNCCSEGSFCSYACPAGYQKSQWPSTQGATGQSVGGIQCSNGKLHLTNKAMSSKLCMAGATEIPVMIKNTMTSNSAVCRTDYPGTEGETIPLDATPGSTQNLTCPDANNYYNWQGGKTSAQYYVNPAGVSVADGCQWGSSANPWGNFAPLNLGVGYSGGNAWLSMFQNLPTTNQKLDFTIELVGDNGQFDNMSGKCKYQNGQYCSGDNYENCNSGTGCTVSIS